MISVDNLIKYSHSIHLSTNTSFEVRNLQNPFTNKIAADIELPDSGYVQVALHNDKGQQVKQFMKRMNKGSNELNIPELNNLPAGMYFISVSYRSETYKRKLVKQ
jgi:hypothetical protein